MARVYFILKLAYALIQGHQRLSNRCSTNSKIFLDSSAGTRIEDGNVPWMRRSIPKVVPETMHNVMQTYGEGSDMDRLTLR